VSELGLALVASALGFGLRHGVDWDHIAAISDLTSGQTRRRRSMTIATMYALGHAVVVLLLGTLAVAFAANLPGWVDAAMGRVVGVTLVALGLYVLYGLVRHGRHFGLRSRWMLVLDLVRRAARVRRREPSAFVEIEHEHPLENAGAHGAALHDDGVPVATGVRSTALVSTRHRHVVALPDDPSVEYGLPTAFGIGMLHGVGAETPTQIVVFAAAAGAGGTAAGLLVLGCFVVGLLVSNSVLAVVATWGFLGASRSVPLYVAICIVTAAVSLFIGVVALSGRSDALPVIFHG